MGISIKKVLSRAFNELDWYKVLSALINPSCPIMPIQNYSYFSIKKNLGHFSLVITTSDDALLLGFSSVVVGLQSSRGCRHRGREEDEKKKKREKLRLKTAALVVNSEGSGICWCSVPVGFQPPTTASSASFLAPWGWLDEEADD